MASIDVQSEAYTKYCPAGLVIDEKIHIKTGGKDVQSWEDKPIKTPFSTGYDIPAMGVCLTEVSLMNNAEGASKGAFDGIEWDDDVYVTLTKLSEGKDYDTSTSQQQSSETYYWNREHKDGDLAGRVPVNLNERVKLMMINYNKEAKSSIVLEYGAAAETTVAYAVLGASLVLSYVF